MITRTTRTALAAMTVLAAVAGATGCKANAASTTNTRPGGGPAAATGPLPAGGTNALPVGGTTAPMPAPGTCHIGTQNGQPLPDPNCTPGATNPQVSQATMATTICKTGWTKTVRPPTSVTNRMKAQSAASYGLDKSATGEYDHLISLELGGAPQDPRNLWVEPGKIPNPKDAVENKLHDAVCSGLVPLATAQQAIAHDWVTAFDDAGLRVAGAKVCLRDNPNRCATHGGGDATGE